MITEDLRRRRLEVIEEHFATEVSQEFERTLATFGGTPHYEIVPTGQVFDVVPRDRRQINAEFERMRLTMRFGKTPPTRAT